MPLLDEAQELPFAHDRVVQVAARELVLAGPRIPGTERLSAAALRPRYAVDAGGSGTRVLDEPVVERAIVLELERAKGVRDPLDGVGLAVRPVVEGVDRPRIARPVVVCVPDAVHQRVAQLHVRRGEVDPGAEHVRSIVELPGPHAPEEVEVLLRRALPVRAGPAGFSHGPAVRADLLLGQAVDVGEAVLDHAQRHPVERSEVVRRVADLAVPLEPQPADVPRDRLDVGRVFRRRIRVVHAQRRPAAVLARHLEVEADGGRVAHVKEAVGFGRKTREHTPPVPPAQDIFGDDLTDEIRTLSLRHGGNLKKKAGSRYGPGPMGGVWAASGRRSGGFASAAASLRTSRRR